eukprot:gene19552-biopygen5511
MGRGSGPAIQRRSRGPDFGVSSVRLLSSGNGSCTPTPIVYGAEST